MTTYNLTTSDTQIAASTEYAVKVQNTGASVVILSRGGRLRPNQPTTVYPDGTALTARADSGIGSVDVTSVSSPVTTTSTPRGRLDVIEATYSRPIGNRLALIGDSITDNGSTLTGQNTIWLSATGYWVWANILLGHRFDLVYQAATDPEFGQSGATVTSLISGGHVSALVAAAPDVAVVQIGTNDITNSRTAAQITADLATIYDTIRGAGIRLVVCTILPRLVVTDDQTKRDTMRAVNRWIRDYVLSHRGVYLCDWYPTLLDVSSSTGLALAAHLTDDVHPNAQGASRLGAVLASVLDRITPPLNRLPQLGDVTNLLTNAYMTGSASGVATGWTSNPANVTSTASKVARTDLVPGEWQQVAISAITGTAANSQHIIQQTVSTGFSVGDRVRAALEFETDAAGWDVRSMYLQLSGAGASDSVMDAFVAGGTPVVYRPASGVLMTEPMTIPTGMTSLTLQARMFGVGTIRWGRAALYRL